MAITREQIFAAADDLDAVGQNPTLAAVRKALGGGSFTTISEGMAEWKARKAAKVSPSPEPAPPAIAERLVELGADIWAAALELANGRLTAEREALDAARAQMEAESAEAAELADQVMAELEDSKAALATATAAERAARTEVDSLRAQWGEARLQAATAEARASEIEKRANDLNAELARVNQQSAGLVSALAAAARPAVAADQGTKGKG
jgi:hypothetical protein